MTRYNSRNNQNNENNGNNENNENKGNNENNGNNESNYTYGPDNENFKLLSSYDYIFYIYDIINILLGDFETITNNAVVQLPPEIVAMLNDSNNLLFTNMERTLKILICGIALKEKKQLTDEKLNELYSALLNIKSYKDKTKLNNKTVKLIEDGYYIIYRQGQRKMNFLIKLMGYIDAIIRYSGSPVKNKTANITNKDAKKDIIGYLFLIHGLVLKKIFKQKNYYILIRLLNSKINNFTNNKIQHYLSTNSNSLEQRKSQNKLLSTSFSELRRKTKQEINTLIGDSKKKFMSIIEPAERKNN